MEDFTQVSFSRSLIVCVQGNCRRVHSKNRKSEVNLE